MLPRQFVTPYRPLHSRWKTIANSCVATTGDPADPDAVHPAFVAGSQHVWLARDRRIHQQQWRFQAPLIVSYSPERREHISPLGTLCCILDATCWES